MIAYDFGFADEYSDCCHVEVVGQEYTVCSECGELVMDPLSRADMIDLGFIDDEDWVPDVETCEA